MRHVQLNEQEKGIGDMVDSLNQNSYFNTLKKLAYFGTTGYYPIGKLEIGNIYSIFSVNPVEKFRSALALRTSNSFSKRIELGIKGAYGFGDKRIKYGALVRCNLSKKKKVQRRENHGVHIYICIFC